MPFASLPAPRDCSQPLHGVAPNSIHIQLQSPYRQARGLASNTQRCTAARSPAVVQSMGQVGVPRVEKRQVTQQEPFSFKVDARAQQKAPAEEAAKPPCAAAPKAMVPPPSHHYAARACRRHGQRPARHWSNTL